MSLAVGPDRARSAAEDHRSRMAARDPLFAPWGDAGTGDPVMVHTVDGAPAYWVVPVERAEGAIGFVRVTGDGVVAAAGAFYRRADDLSGCPAVVTGITHAQAEAAAVGAAGPAAVDWHRSALYVHDGPPGREAWLVVVGGRRFFVTSAGAQEQHAGSG